MLELILEKGADNDLIATAMGIKLNTVRHHVVHMMDKLRYSSRVEMAVMMLHKRYAERLGLRRMD